MQYSTLKSTHRENSYSSSDAANEFHTSSLTALSDSFGTCEHTESTTNSNKSVVRKARNIFLNYFFLKYCPTTSDHVISDSVLYRSSATETISSACTAIVVQCGCNKKLCCRREAARCFVSLSS